MKTFNNFLETENLSRILDKTAESAIREDDARRKLLQMEAEVENRRWEQRSSEIAL